MRKRKKVGAGTSNKTFSPLVFAKQSTKQVIQLSRARLNKFDVIIYTNMYNRDKISTFKRYKPMFVIKYIAPQRVDQITTACLCLSVAQAHSYLRKEQIVYIANELSNCYVMQSLFFCVKMRCLKLGQRDVHQTRTWVALKNVWEPLV